MEDQKDKKKFWNTGFGGFLRKAGKAVPSISGIALDVAASVATGNVGGAISAVRSALEEKAANDRKAGELLAELHAMEMQFQVELSMLEVADRDSAREREREYVRAKKFDIEHLLLAVVGLLALAFVLYALVYRDIPDENRDLFIHAIGIVECIVVGMFSYHFGSSKSSRSKDKILADVMKKENADSQL